MHGPQVGGHVVFSVELLGADRARVRLSVQVRGHVVPVEVGGMRVRIVAHLAPVGVALLKAVAANANRASRVVKADPATLRGTWRRRRRKGRTEFRL